MSDHVPAQPSGSQAFWEALVAAANDLPALLDLIAQQVVDVLGVGCVLTTVSEDGQVLEPQAVRHADPVVSDAMAAVLGGQPARVGEAIYRHALDGVLLTTPDGHILAANPAACDILGATEREIVSGGREAWIVPEDPRLARALEERAAAGRARTELAMRRAGGTTFVADISSTVYTARQGTVRTVTIFRDVSAQVAARDAAMTQLAELSQAADRDPLTGLWNRRGFAVAAAHALAEADRNELVSQLVFLDVDGLKAINDRLGHAAGDAAIVAVATAVDRSLRDVDVACRDMYQHKVLRRLRSRA